MGSHDDYGKAVLRAAAGAAFADRGNPVEVNYGAGRPARIDGAVGADIAVEIESRTSKQVRGAVLDLLFHRFDKKLLVLIPMYMSDCDVCAEQCRNALARFMNKDNFRVVVLTGSGTAPLLDNDTEIVRNALHELGFNFASRSGNARPAAAGLAAPQS